MNGDINKTLPSEIKMLSLSGIALPLIRKGVGMSHPSSMSKRPPLKTEDFIDDFNLLSYKSVLTENLFESVMHSMNKHAKYFRDESMKAHDRYISACSEIDDESTLEIFREEEEYSLMHKRAMYNAKDYMVSRFLSPSCVHVSSHIGSDGKESLTYFRLFITTNYAFHRPIKKRDIGNLLVMPIKSGELFVPPRSQSEILPVDFCLSVCSVVESKEEIKTRGFHDIPADNEALNIAGVDVEKIIESNTDGDLRGVLSQSIRQCLINPLVDLSDYLAIRGMDWVDDYVEGIVSGKSTPSIKSGN